MRVAAQLTHILYIYWKKVLHMWIKEDFYLHKLHIFVCSLDFFFDSKDNLKGFADLSLLKYV